MGNENNFANLEQCQQRCECKDCGWLKVAYVHVCSL